MSKSDEIKEALEKATPGKWVPYWNGDVDFFGTENNSYMFPADDFNVSDALLIANAPEWLQYLLQENQRYKETLEWYAQGEYKQFWYEYESPNDGGQRARQALNKEGETE